MADSRAPKSPAAEPLTVRRSFTSPPDRVFRAWTSPEELKQQGPFASGASAPPRNSVQGRYSLFAAAEVPLLARV